MHDLVRSRNTRRRPLVDLLAGAGFIATIGLVAYLLARYMGVTG